MAVITMPKVCLSKSAETVLQEAKSVTFVGSIEELVELAVPKGQADPDGFQSGISPGADGISAAVDDGIDKIFGFVLFFFSQHNV